jgi:hypothetical protein
MTAEDKSLPEREEKTKQRVTTMILNDAYAAGYVYSIVDA